MTGPKFVNRMISMTASHSETLIDLSRETGIPQSVLVRQGLELLFEQKRQEKELLEAAKAAERVRAAEAARAELEAKGKAAKKKGR